MTPEERSLDRDALPASSGPLDRDASSLGAAGGPMSLGAAGDRMMTLTLNGEPVELADGATVADLVAAWAPSVRGVAAAVDGAVVPRGTWGRVVLRDGQRVELLTAVQGG
jgi:sulfur carrier protein